MRTLVLACQTMRRSRFLCWAGWKRANEAQKCLFCFPLTSWMHWDCSSGEVRFVVCLMTTLSCLPGQGPSLPTEDRSVSVICGAQDPEHLRSTQLQKHLTKMSQIWRRTMIFTNTRFFRRLEANDGNGKKSWHSYWPWGMALQKSLMGNCSSALRRKCVRKQLRNNKWHVAVE